MIELIASEIIVSRAVLDVTSDGGPSRASRDLKRSPKA